MYLQDDVYHNLTKLHCDINSLICNSLLKTKDNIIEKFILDFQKELIFTEDSYNYDVINQKINKFIFSYVKSLHYKDKSKINSNNDILNTYKIHYEWLEKLLLDDPIDVWLSLLLYTIIINNISYKNKQIANLKTFSSFKLVYFDTLMELYKIIYF